jgi:hypothetical protein
VLHTRHISVIVLAAAALKGSRSLGVSTAQSPSFATPTSLTHLFFLSLPLQSVE